MPGLLQCYEEHPDPRYSDQRVCIFENLVVHNNTIYYVSSEVQELPKVRAGSRRRHTQQGPLCRALW